MMTQAKTAFHLHDQIRITDGGRKRRVDFWISRDASVCRVRKGLSATQLRKIAAIVCEHREGLLLTKR
jgi:hypothetical protein